MIRCLTEASHIQASVAYSSLTDDMRVSIDEGSSFLSINWPLHIAQSISALYRLYGTSPFGISLCVVPHLSHSMTRSRSVAFMPVAFSCLLHVPWTKSFPSQYGHGRSSIPVIMKIPALRMQVNRDTFITTVSQEGSGSDWSWVCETHDVKTGWSFPSLLSVIVTPEGTSPLRLPWDLSRGRFPQRALLLHPRSFYITP